MEAQVKLRELGNVTNRVWMSTVCGAFEATSKLVVHATLTDASIRVLAEKPDTGRHFQRIRRRVIRVFEQVREVLQYGERPLRQI